MLAQKLKIPIITVSQLNRNIENRSHKEPMLSDLKESGCISSENNIKLSLNMILEVQVVSLIKNNPIINSCNNKNVLDRLKKILQTFKTKNLISIKNKYLFEKTRNKKSLKLTFNHKALNTNTWIRENQILPLTRTSILINTKKNLVRQKYIQKIVFTSYSKSYDINKDNYPNIISEDNILHNSIEQDADIIIILYEMQNIKYTQNSNGEKIIDLKISKNRNGQTGYCQLLFETHTNIFKNIN